MKVIYLNMLLDKKFEEDLAMYTRVQVETNKLQRKQALELFCIERGINLGDDTDDDITYDCLKKMEYRFREKKDKKVILHLSPAKNCYTQSSFLFTSVAC